MMAEAKAPNVVRAFIAFRLNDDVRAALRDVQGILRRAPTRVSWVRPENLHVSVVFLGHTFDETVQGVATDLDPAVADHAPFTVDVEHIGTFGKPTAPRVLWAGVAADPRLMALQQTVSGVCEQHGFPPETRLYVPHVTLGRVRSKQNIRDLVSLTDTVNTQSFGTLSVETVDIMLSELRPDGPVYTRHHAARLHGQNQSAGTVCSHGPSKT